MHPRRHDTHDASSFTKQRMGCPRFNDACRDPVLVFQIKATMFDPTAGPGVRGGCKTRPERARWSTIGNVASDTPRGAGP